MPRYSIAALLLLTFVIAMELTAWRIEPLLAAFPLVPVVALFVVLLVATIGRVVSALFGGGWSRRRRDVEE
ncbi:hypothetical protein NG895_03370 [Aeoliella sp. ICT_H6.2]|uniref:Uncharacterized protein n=1 Tax=Aeoliella straminimaris TaxID=2954799 RepID=A0A9X2JEE8_9BACT|nr:hypothetical protein [Aeoliella straminimaris]MCO6042940.1 hypothetical protein [Aeoliella straminimaris]